MATEAAPSGAASAATTTAPPSASAPAPDPKAAKAPPVEENSTAPDVDAAMERIAEKERSFREERKKLESERKEMEAYKADVDAFRAIKGKRDIIAAAKLLGYDDPKEAIRDGALKLAGEQAKPKTADDRVAELEKRWAEREKSDAEAKKQAEEEKKAQGQRAEAETIDAAKASHREKMASWLSENEGSYPELAAEQNAAEAIRREIWAHWNKTYDSDTGEGEHLQPEKAAATLESYLVKRAERAAAIRAKHKKPEGEKAAEPAKPPAEGTTEVPRAGEEKGPAAKQGQGTAPLDFESMNVEELRKVDPDTLSDQDRHRLSVALLEWGFRAKK